MLKRYKYKYIKGSESYLGFLVYDVARYYRLAFDKKMGAHGLTRSQGFTLGYVYRQEGVSQTELADLLGIGKVTVGGLIDRMEAAGFLERRSDSKDRRIKRIYLTKKSQSMVRKIMVNADEIVRESVESLSETDKKALIRSLQSIERSLLNLNSKT